MQNHDLRTFPTHQHLRSVVCLVFGALCAFQVSAQTATVQYSRFDKFMAQTTGNTHTIGFGSNGTPVVANAFAGSGPNIGRFGIAADAATKGLTLSGSGSLPIGTAGRAVPVAFAGKVSADAMAAAVGKLARFATNPYFAFGMAAAPFIYDWLTRTDIEVLPEGGFQKTLPASTCGPGFSEFLALCNHNYLDTCVVIKSHNPDQCVVASTVYQMEPRGFPLVGTSTVVPYTLSEVVADLATVQPAPEVLKELFTIDQTGTYSDQTLKDLAITNVVVSGPSIVVGPVETKVEPVTSTTPEKITTTKTDYNCVYVMADVTCTDKKTEIVATKTIDPATGLPKTETTTTTTEKETPLTEQKDPCLEHPNRNGCREDEFDTPPGEIPKTSKTITFQAENLGFGGGSCPSNKTMTLHGSGQTVTVIDWADNCSKITTYAKPMILAMAVFSALMIIFVGGKIE